MICVRKHKLFFSISCLSLDYDFVVDTLHSVLHMTSNLMVCQIFTLIQYNPNRDKTQRDDVKGKPDITI